MYCLWWLVISRKSALNTRWLKRQPVAAVCDCGTPWTFLLPFFYSTDRSEAVIPVLVVLFVALWFILWGGLFYVLPCVILFLCFLVLLVLRLLCLGKRELIWVLFVRLFDLCLFGFVGFLFLLVSGKVCGLWLWYSLDFFSYLFFLFAFPLCHWKAMICDCGFSLTYSVLFVFKLFKGEVILSNWFCLLHLKGST